MAIPASTIVSVTPGVLNPGGTGLTLAGMILTQNPLGPYGPPTSFANLTAVGDYFGTGSTEYEMASVYFQGFDGSNIKPGLLWYAFYPTTNVAAWVRGTALQPWSTTLQSVMQAYIPAVTSSASTIEDNVLVVASVTSGYLTAGMLLTGTGVTAGTRILSQLSGTPGGAGQYVVSVAQTVSATAITAAWDLSITVDGTVKTAASLDLSAVTSWSSVAIALASALGLSGGQTLTFDSFYSALTVKSGTTGASSTITYANGAFASIAGLNAGVISQGAAAVATTTQAQIDFMNSILTHTTNFATVMTAWGINGLTGNPATIAQGLAQWVASTNGRYAYAVWDTDATVLASPASYVGFGQWLRNSGISGVAAVYGNAQTAAMIAGMAASTDFTQQDGRVSYCYKVNSLMPSALVTDATSYSNLTANGYSAYCQFGVNQSPNMLANGQISGSFLWIDSYINQLYLNASLQQALVVLLQTQKSLPYNRQGYNLITSAVQGPINAALKFGTIRSNVKPSPSEAAQMNAAAGVSIDSIVGSRGWYFQVQDADAATRAARKSPPCNLWYMDGQSVQQINLASIDVL